jgi:hypothetical protein
VPTAELLGLLAVALLAWLWLDGLKARDVAVAAARQACASEGLQFLDDTVASAGFRLSRSTEGTLELRRAYAFEFSDTGNNRQRGSVVMVGHRVLLLNIDRRIDTGDHSVH